MKTRFLKTAVIAAAAMTMVVGATVVANAQEIDKPRVASSCNNVNCRGHVSVWNGASGVDIFVCVPNSWGGSFDEYRTAAEDYFAVKSGVPAPVDFEVSQPSKDMVGRAFLAAAPVDDQDLVAYVANHRKGNCKNIDCKGHVFATDPATKLTSPYCIPEGWTASAGELQVKIEEYLGLKAGTIAPAPAAPAVNANLYVVKKGDTLSKIAKACYGDSKLWKVIYEANKGTVKNANTISVGQILVIPAPGTVVVAPAPVVVPAAPVVTPVEKKAMNILNAKIQQTIDVHNAVVDAVDAGVISLSPAAMDYINTSADALSVIENLKAKDYTNISAYNMYHQMDAYMITITQLLK